MSVDLDELLSEAMTRSTSDIVLSENSLGRAVRRVARRRQMAAAAAAVVVVAGGAAGLAAGIASSRGGHRQVIQASAAARDLVATPRVRQQLIAEFALAQGVPSEDVDLTTGSLYYGRLTSTNTHWAVATFRPSAAASIATGLQPGLAFQPGPWVFSKKPGQTWLLTADARSMACPHEVPVAMAKVWGLLSAQGCRPSTGATASRDRRYSNARFGFSVTVPASFRADLPPVDGDGRKFTSPAGTASVTAYGADNLFSRTPEAELSVQQAAYEHQGGTVTYHQVIGDVVAVSGTNNGRVFYLREVVLAKAIYSLQWSYPVVDKASYDQAVNRSAATFQPGPDRTG